MLLSFTVQNWMSFKEKTTFSMVATAEKNHRERLPYIKDYKLRLLPVAGIYGGNASGKTNLFYALKYAREFIVEGVRYKEGIPVEPFLLDDKSKESPSRFTFIISINEKIYKYGFSVTHSIVNEEWLLDVLKTTEKEIFRRYNGTFTEFDDEFLKSLSNRVNENQLFLTTAVNLKCDLFNPVYDWFDKCLVLISPNSRFIDTNAFIDEENFLNGIINNGINKFDTGIDHIGGIPVPIDNILHDEKKEFEDNLQDKEQCELYKFGERIVIRKKDGKLEAQKLVSYHLDMENNPIVFNMQMESDGTRRVLDLLPAFISISLKGFSKVFVIDELDRSLHTLLTRQLLESYLDSCTPESRSQLLFTTHDVLLMDQDLLRRDEIWVTERDRTGKTKLIAFSEYKDIRKDKDIRKSYLQGRMGGIPRILMQGAFSSMKNAEEKEAEN